MLYDELRRKSSSTEYADYHTMHILDRLFNRKIIIGIHGLANKPPKDLLVKWWEAAIREGLANIGCKGTRFCFVLVYWADLLYELPEDPMLEEKKGPLYLDDPYTPGDPGSYNDFTPSRMKRKLLEGLEKSIDKVFLDDHSYINYDKFADLLIRKLFRDLDCYYHKVCSVPKFDGLDANHEIRKRLADALRRYRRKDILLISHSMGTIISYDVLTQTAPEVRIHTFITMGSPLGIPVIQKKIIEEQGKSLKMAKRIVAPENIQHEWHNFSDLDDPVAVNYNLSDDIEKNSRGVAPQDTIVFNNYVNNGKRNAHKVYGYLRAPEVAKVINEYCTGGRQGFIQAARSWLNRVLKKDGTSPSSI